MKLRFLHYTYTTLMKHDGSSKEGTRDDLQEAEGGALELAGGGGGGSVEPLIKSARLVSSESTRVESELTVNAIRMSVWLPSKYTERGYARLERTSDERESNRASRSFRSVSTLSHAPLCQ